MLNQKVQFTKDELKRLTNITYDDLGSLLRLKTDKQYTLVEQQMILDIRSRLFSNITHIAKISDVAYNSWQDIIKENREVAHKWGVVKGGD